MKRIMAFLLCVLLVFALAACDTADTSNGSSGAPPQESAPVHTEQELYDIWHSLVGYWNAAEGLYAVLDMEDGHTAAFMEGVWAAGGGRGYGSITGIAASGGEELTVTVLYPATEGTEMDEPLPEAEVIVVVDYSGKERDGKIRIKIGDGEWREYAFAGNRSNEAYQTYLADQQGDLTVTGDTEEEKIASLWKLLEGCWGVDDRFVLFTYNADGKPIFQSGTWEWHFPSNTRDPAVVTSISDFDGVTFTLGISYLANEETAADEQDLREYHYTIMVGIEDLAEGIVTVEAPEDEIRTYAFLARTYEEAYETANQGTW